jgi:drug/metabolite transporter (DMT)-like permease
MNKAFANPYLLLVLTVLFWSGNMVLGRGIRADVPPMALAFLRWVIAFALTLPFALPHCRAQWPTLARGWKAVLLLGLLGVSGYNTFAYLALQYTTATSATLLNSFIPVATIALAWGLLGKRLGRVEAIGVLISLSGVLTIVGRGDFATFLHLTLNRGDLWMLVAVLTWGLYTVGLHWRPAGVHPMLMLAAMTLVGVVTLAPLAAWEMTALERHINGSVPTYLAIAYVGIFPGFLGYVFYNAAVAAVGPNRSALFIHLMPVFATILAAIFLGERPQPYHFVGIALVFAGIGLTTRRRAA